MTSFLITLVEIKNFLLHSNNEEADKAQKWLCFCCCSIEPQFDGISLPTVQRLYAAMISLPNTHLFQVHIQMGQRD